jgi:hypothetical protein
MLDEIQTCLQVFDDCFQQEEVVAATQRIRKQTNDNK